MAGRAPEQASSGPESTGRFHGASSLECTAAPTHRALGDVRQGEAAMTRCTRPPPGSRPRPPRAEIVRRLLEEGWEIDPEDLADAVCPGPQSNRRQRVGVRGGQCDVHCAVRGRLVDRLAGEHEPEADRRDEGRVARMRARDQAVSTQDRGAFQAPRGESDERCSSCRGASQVAVMSRATSRRRPISKSASGVRPASFLVRA